MVHLIMERNSHTARGETAVLAAPTEETEGLELGEVLPVQGVPSATYTPDSRKSRTRDSIPGGLGGEAGAKEHVSFLYDELTLTWV